MKVYIAGPMRGLVQWNFPAFDMAKVLWTSKGHIVFSPADMARASGYGCHDEDSAYPHQQGGKEHLKHVMLTDIASIYAADALALLPGWERSRGATVEVALAQFLGLPLYDAITMELLDIPVAPYTICQDD